MPPPACSSETTADLTAQVLREPGCLTFTAYEARMYPACFYLYEVYATAAAFGEHLQTQSVHDFIAAVPPSAPPAGKPRATRRQQRR